jgi:site-specific recombinase
MESPPKPHSFVSLPLHSTNLHFAVSLIQAMQADLAVATDILDQTTQLLDKGLDTLDLNSAHINHLGSLENTGTSTDDLESKITQCGETIQSLKQELDEDVITLSVVRKIKEACSSQISLLLEIKK